MVASPPTCGDAASSRGTDAFGPRVQRGNDTARWPTSALFLSLFENYCPYACPLSWGVVTGRAVQRGKRVVGALDKW
jgi:hypothetical protein